MTAPHCTFCDEPVTSFHHRGTTYTPQDVAAITRQRYSAVLCGACWLDAARVCEDLFEGSTELEVRVESANNNKIEHAYGGSFPRMVTLRSAQREER